MLRLRNFLYTLLFFGLSVPIVLFAPVSALFGRRALRGYANGWAGLQAVLARHILGVRTRIEGQVLATPALYAAKHQSMFETLQLARLLDSPAIVMKRELAQIPVWGWCARRYGVIVVDRDASASALRGMMREAQTALGEGRSVLIFPEGTRVRPGEAPPLRSGFAGLYRILKLPVVPIALDSGRFWPRKGPARPGTITLAFQPDIAPGLPRAEIETQVHRAINALEPALPAPE